MKAKLYLIGSVIYVALAIVLGIAVPFLAPYAVLIGALVSGMYVGTKGLTPAKAAIDGMVTGVIGGVLAGAITIFAGSFIMATTGISILDQVVSIVGGFLSPYVGAFAWFISAGIILGAIGGLMGKKIKKR
jgi:hypothetical protein